MALYRAVCSATTDEIDDYLDFCIMFSEGEKTALYSVTTFVQDYFVIAKLY